MLILKFFSKTIPCLPVTVQFSFLKWLKYEGEEKKREREKGSIDVNIGFTFI